MNSLAPLTVGNGNIPLRIGNLINTVVHGGPYRNIPDDMFGVKMAEEIKQAHDVDIPTRDFCVPKVSDLQTGVVLALMAMINGHEVYAGCMGGIGRTGLFLAALAKVQIEYRRSKHRAGRGEDPVLYVRKHFIPHAVETQEQKQFIADFDVSSIVNWLDVTQVALGKNTGFPKGEPTKPINNAVDAAALPPYVKPEWVAEEDKVDNPAFDKHAREWKGKRDESNLAELVERDLDWVDKVGADSAEDFFTSDSDAAEAQLADIYTLVEELEYQVSTRLGTIEKKLEAHTTAASLVNRSFSSRLKRSFNRMNFIEDRLDDLTKPTILERIRSGNWFND